GEYPRAQLHCGTACDLLVLGCGRDQDRGGALVTGELGEQLGLGGHDVVVQLRGGHVHLLGTVLGQRGLAGVGSVTGPYCGGLAAPLGLGGRGGVGQPRGGHLRLLGTVLGQRGLAGVGSVTDPCCGGLTDATCHGQQFGGDLLDLSVDVVDEDEDLSHVL